MTIQHLAMVYAAGGMGPNEKLLLGAYCNHTDAHGYCWPGIDRLMDETGMSRATVKRVNASLRSKALIRSIRRVSRVTGESISNLTRVNVPLLDSMRRPERHYDDNLIAIEFDDSKPLKMSSDLPMAQNEPTPGLKMSPPPAQNEPTPGLKMSPKTSVEPSFETSLETSSPSGTPEARLSQPPAPEEAAEPGDSQPPSIDQLDSDAGAAAKWVAGLPWKRQPGKRQRETLTAAALVAVAAGWTLPGLWRELTTELGNVESRYGVWLHRLTELPTPPPVPSQRGPECPPGACAAHPGAGLRDGQCAACWLDSGPVAEPGPSLYEVQDIAPTLVLVKSHSGPAPIDMEGLRARLEATRAKAHR